MSCEAMFVELNGQIEELQETLQRLRNQFKVEVGGGGGGGGGGGRPGGGGRSIMRATHRQSMSAGAASASASVAGFSPFGHRQSQFSTWQPQRPQMPENRPSFRGTVSTSVNRFTVHNSGRGVHNSESELSNRGGNGILRDIQTGNRRISIAPQAVQTTGTFNSQAQAQAQGMIGGGGGGGGRRASVAQWKEPLTDLGQEGVSTWGDRNSQTSQVQFSALVLNLALHPLWEEERKARNTVRLGASQLEFDVFAKTSFRAITENQAIIKDRKNSFSQKFVIEPTSYFALFWNLMEMFLLCFDVVAIPLSVFELPENQVFTTMKYLSLVFWTTDICLSCFKGYVTKGGEVEMRLFEVFKHYLQSRVAYDLVLVGIEWFNFLMEEELKDSGGSQYASSGRFIRFIRFSRLLKVGKMKRLLESFMQRIHSNVVLTIIDITKVLIIIYVFTHFEACGWYGVCLGANDPESWALVDADRGFWYLYATSLHWSFSQMGYGSIEVFPTNQYERTYAVMTTCACLTAAAWFVGSVVILMARLQALQKEQREQEEQLRDFLSKHQVSLYLRNRIWMFLQRRRAMPKKRVEESTVELIKHLPKTVTLELRAEVYIPILTSHPFFCTYAVSQADKFAMYRLIEQRGLQEASLFEEHELFANGEPAGYMFWIVRGMLLYRPSDEKVTFGGEGSANPRLKKIDRMGTLGGKIDKASSTQSLGSKGVEKKIRRVSTVGSVGTEKLDSQQLEMFEDGNAEEIGEGKWICEPALWLQWLHVGWSVAKIRSEMVVLEVDMFQWLMSQELPQARQYARAFLQYAERHRHRLNDIFYDEKHLRTMAQDIFEPPMSFKLDWCTPVENIGHGRNEWSPSDRRQWQKLWTSPFKEAHIYNRSALISTMTKEFKSDCILVYQTLFPPQACSFNFKDDEEREIFNLKITFLKRLLLIMAVCGVNFTAEDNGAAVRPWPYPLASTICHGGRIAFKLCGVTWREVLNFLCYQDGSGWSWDDGVPKLMYTRKAATHSVRLDMPTGRVCEVRTKSISSFDRGQMGIDMPLGGLGNPAPQHRGGNLFIGPSGVPYKKSRVGRSGKHHYVANIQHGHIYIRGDDFGPMDVPVLFSNSTEPYPVAMMVNYPPSLSSSEAAPALTGSMGSMGLALDDAARTDTFRSSGILPSMSPQDALAGIQQEWICIRKLRETADLKDVLVRAGKPEVVQDIQAVFDLLSHLQKDLILERKSGSSELRCRGELVQVVLELETVDGQVRVLVQREVTAKPVTAQNSGRRGGRPDWAAADSFLEDPDYDDPQDNRPRGYLRNSWTKDFFGDDFLSSEPDEQDRRGGSPREVPRLDEERTLEDLRVMTMLSSFRENWVTAVTNYCQKEFNLCDAAIAKIVAGCMEQTAETFIYPCDEAPTVCYNHRAAVQTYMPLSYNALRMKARIKEQDLHLFGVMMQTEFFTVTEDADLAGFDKFGRGTRGSITRSWAWLPVEEVEDASGVERPSGSNTFGVRPEKARLGSLLVGVEGSAPLKDDLFGNTHTPDGTSKSISAFGKRKWKDYRQGGQDVPADLGGIRVVVNESRFQQLKELCEDMFLSDATDKNIGGCQDKERDLFRKLLPANDDMVRDIMEDYMQSARGVPKSFPASSRAISMDGISLHEGLNSIARSLQLERFSSTAPSRSQAVSSIQGSPVQDV